MNHSVGRKSIPYINSVYSGKWWFDHLFGAYNLFVTLIFLTGKHFFQELRPASNHLELIVGAIQNLARVALLTFGSILKEVI